MSRSPEECQGAALFVLARELWVVADRLRSLEAVLAERGIDVAADVDAHQPSDEDQARRDAACRRLVADLTRELAGRPAALAAAAEGATGTK
jgi:hypothetical protein